VGDVFVLVVSTLFSMARLGYLSTRPRRSDAGKTVQTGSSEQKHQDGGERNQKRKPEWDEKGQQKKRLGVGTIEMTKGGRKEKLGLNAWRRRSDRMGGG